MQTLKLNPFNYLFIIFAVALVGFQASCSSNTKISNSGKADLSIFKVAEDLVISAKEKTDPSELFNSLAIIPQETLFATLDTDEKKKAFWMNVYNGAVQHILMKNPELFDDRSKFFGEKRFKVADEELSFDKIEHGFIRGSMLKLSLGLVKDPFVGRFERNVRVDETDGRIHFALNCGAKSCPYIAVFDYRKTNEQLEKSAMQYLKQTTKVEGNTVKVTSLMNWFRGDFGSKNDIEKFLKRLDVISKDVTIDDLEYLDYDWTLELGNYKTL